MIIKEQQIWDYINIVRIMLLIFKKFMSLSCQGLGSEPGAEAPVKLQGAHLNRQTFCLTWPVTCIYFEFVYFIKDEKFWHIFCLIWILVKMILRMSVGNANAGNGMVNHETFLFNVKGLLNNKGAAVKRSTVYSCDASWYNYFSRCWIQTS